MNTILIDRSTGRIAFGQSGIADRRAMEKDARTSGLIDFEIRELSDDDYRVAIKAQNPVEPKGPSILERVQALEAAVFK